MNGKKKTMRAVIEIIIAVLVIIAVYFIIRGMDRHDVRIRQAATENEMQRVWKEFQENPSRLSCIKRTGNLRIRFRPIFLSEQTKAEMKTPAGKNIVDRWQMH